MIYQKQALKKCFVANDAAWKDPMHEAMIVIFLANEKVIKMKHLIGGKDPRYLGTLWNIV